MNSFTTFIDKNTLIPDLLLNAPEVRPVLDRYGLKGCGGPLGPMESLEFFSNAHDAPLEKLFKEIQEALDRQDGSATQDAPEIDSSQVDIADVIYRPFFQAGIAVVLSLGALWGAYLLLRIGLLGSFSAVGIHEVNAHGHAQIFGWVGLFVMGFAYQAFPRFKHTSLAYPKWAYATLWMMATGLVCRSSFEWLGIYAPAFWNIAIAASILEIVAIASFVWIIVATLRHSGKPLAFYDYYIISALFWFVVQAVYSSLLFYSTISVNSREALLHVIANWQAPLREIQIHGFAMMMILGVSQRMFHNFYGLAKPNPRLSRVVLVCLNLAIVGIVSGYLLMRAISHAWAGLWYASILLLAIGFVVLVNDWKIFAKPKDSDRSLKFLRAAYIWLIVSLGMLALLPVHQFGLLPYFAPTGSAIHMGFSHAYYGAIRHAITVGFISLMIVGVSAKVVPTLNGINLQGLSSLWLPFILINAGCALRVIGQTLTDFSPALFPFTAISGFLEVTGLGVWGTHLLLIMAGRARIRNSVSNLQTSASALRDGETIQKHHRVGDVLNHYPDMLDIFLKKGFTPLKNHFLRNTLAKTITVESACRRIGIDSDAFVQMLNAERDKHKPKPIQPKLYQITN